MKRVLVPIEGHDPESWPLALAYATTIADAVGVPPKVVLLLHTMQQIRGSSLPAHLGQQQANQLAAKKSLSLKGGALSLETLRTLPSRIPNGVIIAYYADDKLLEAAEDVGSLAGIVAVPDFSGDCDSWTSRQGAIVHGQEVKAPDRLIDDPVVERALTQLLSVVNPSTGIGHPRDKAMADEVLRILRAKGHELKPDAIRSWALQQGWKSRQADDLFKLAGKVAALKSKPRISGFHDPDGRYTRWQ